MRQYFCVRYDGATIEAMKSLTFERTTFISIVNGEESCSVFLSRKNSFKLGLYLMTRSKLRLISLVIIACAVIDGIVWELLHITSAIMP